MWRGKIRSASVEYGAYICPGGLRLSRYTFSPVALVTISTSCDSIIRRSVV